MKIIEKIKSFLLRTFATKILLELPQYRSYPYQDNSGFKNEFKQQIENFPIAFDANLDFETKSDMPLEWSENIPEALAKTISPKELQIIEGYKDTFPICKGKIEKTNSKYGFVVQGNDKFWIVLRGNGLELYKKEESSDFQQYSIDYNYDKEGRPLSSIKVTADLDGKPYSFDMIGKKKGYLSLLGNNKCFELRMLYDDNQGNAEIFRQETYSESEEKNNGGFFVRMKSKNMRSDMMLNRSNTVSLYEHYIDQQSDPVKIKICFEDIEGLENPYSIEFRYDQETETYVDEDGIAHTIDEIREIEEQECGIKLDFYAKLIRQFASKDKSLAPIIPHDILEIVEAYQKMKSQKRGEVEDIQNN